MPGIRTRSYVRIPRMTPSDSRPRSIRPPLDQAAPARMLSPDDTQQLLQAGSAGALSDAAAFIRRRLSADGSSDGSDGDFSAPERQWAALLDWARAGKKILPLIFPPPEREGGREYDVTLHEPSGRWIKFTKPSASGYTVSWHEAGTPFLHNALPLVYLQRLIWQNEIFGDDIQLVGLWEPSPHRWCIVTSQSGLQGIRASLEKPLPDPIPLKIEFPTSPRPRIGFWP